MLVNRERVRKRIAELNSVGKDPRGGNTRLSFTAEDRRARDLFCGWLKECGAALRVDPIGNIIARFSGLEDDLPAIAVGSHLDTVPNGGRFDGVLGCLAALECAEVLKSSKQKLKHPLEVIVFVDEEGSHFGTGLLGSRAMLGKVTAEELRKAKDTEGVSAWQAIADFGLQPEKLADAVRSGRDMAAFIELHIEQGGTLYSEKIPIGAVTAIVGIKRFELRFEGEANHAGTTCFTRRKDALLSAAKAIVAVREETGRLGKPDTVATVGKIHAWPGSVNVVAGRVTCSLEIRDVEANVIELIGTAVKKRCKEISVEDGVAVTVEEMAFVPPVPLDGNIIKAIEDSCSKFKVGCRLLPSGAGHDAQSLARICPTGMIFVPSRSGISHAPEEFTAFEDIKTGIDVLLQTVLNIDGGET
jgi:hydantoinase/carbamoylase family amidase